MNHNDFDTEKTVIHQAFCNDCLTVLPSLPDNSFDMILCDLPYSITNNTWDSPVALEDYIIVGERKITFTELNNALWVPRKRQFAKEQQTLWELLSQPMGNIVRHWNENKQPGLWSNYKRIIKPHGVIVLFGAGMFSSELMRTGKDLWRYNMVWEKNHATGFLNANRMPLRIHEDILVFYKKLPAYHPQKSTGHPPVHSYVKHTSDGTNYGKTKLEISGGGSTERYPTSVWRFSSDTQKAALHPTQKPLALCEELIKTYTDEGNLVLDNCAGSFTTVVACDNLNRNWIAIEKDEGYFQVGMERVNQNRVNLGLPCINPIKT